MKLHHLIYFSFDNDLGPDDLRAIAEASERNNAAAGLTGVLIHLDGVFFQVLEGQRSNISALLRRIIQDPRHSDFTICLSSDIEQRHFQNVPMKLIQSHDIDRAAHEHILGREGVDPKHMSGETIWEMCMDIGEAHGVIR